MSTARKLMIALAAACLMAPGAMALNVGDNITIPDNDYGNSAWTDADSEDNEVEPQTLHGDEWDLEGFFLETNVSDETTLSMVGTYDFDDGANANGSNYPHGDLFIDIDGNAQYGDFSGPQLDNNLYDFVLDLNFDTLTFDLVDIRFGGSTSSVTAITPGSDPYRYEAGSGGTNVTTGNSFSHTEDVSIDDQPLIANDAVGTRIGEGLHNVAQFDWTAIVAALDSHTGTEFETFTLHFTMLCGNDNLMGNATRTQEPPIPEPASMALLGMGVLGIAMRRRFVA